MKLARLALLLALAATAVAAAAPHIKRMKLAVTNPSAAARPAQNVVVPVAMLKRIAPDFSAGNAIVVTTGAANLEDDAKVLETTELPPRRTIWTATASTTSWSSRSIWPPDRRAS